MSLKIYKVDLHDYCGEEFDRLYGLLDQWSWTISIYPDMQRAFIVTWKEKQSITEITGIPMSKIQALS